MKRNPKILSPDPIILAPYAGFTYLFDNPALDVRQPDSSSELLNADLADPKHALYSSLRHFVAGVFNTFRLRQFKFCPLDPTTYHVTACDGMTLSAMEHQPQASGRLDVARKLLREGGSGAPELRRQLAPPFSVQPSELGIHFQFSNLEVINRDGAALVATLQPADADSERFFQLLRAERRRISASFGLPPSDGPEAHVSLGYFFDDGLADYFEDELSQLEIDDLRAQTISFYSISLYWFTDMQTFWRST